MRSAEEIMSDVDVRNAARAASGLNLYNLKEEALHQLETEYQVELIRSRAAFVEKVGEKMYAKLLKKYKREQNLPDDWVPRGSWFNGNPNFFYELRVRVDRLHNRACRTQISEINKRYEKNKRELTT